MGALSQHPPQLFPLRYFSVGYTIPIPWPRSQRGSLSSSQAEIHGTGAVTGGDVGPCKVYLGRGCLSWSLFLCRKQGLLVPLWKWSCVFFCCWVGKMMWLKNPPLFRFFYNWCWKRVALVMGWMRQDPIFFSGTIRSNLLSRSPALFGTAGEDEAGLRWIGGGYDDSFFLLLDWDLDSSIFVAVLGEIPIHHTQLNPVK